VREEHVVPAGDQIDDSTDRGVAKSDEIGTPDRVRPGRDREPEHEIAGGHHDGHVSHQILHEEEMPRVCLELGGEQPEDAPCKPPELGQLHERPPPHNARHPREKGGEVTEIQRKAIRERPGPHPEHRVGPEPLLPR
jgi:hypothetical protein